MHSRSLLFAATAGVAFIACTSTRVSQEPGAASTFVSDRISIVTRGRGPDIILRDGVLATPPGGTGPLEQMVQTMSRVDSSREALVRYARASHRRTVATAIHEAIVTDLRPELGRITAPITALYVVPANVPVTPDEFERAMLLLFSNAPQTRLIRISDSNHYIQIDQPARFVAEVNAFMRRN